MRVSSELVCAGAVVIAVASFSARATAQQLFEDPELFSYSPNHYVALADVDGDDDLDAIVAGIFDYGAPPASGQPFLINRNDGSGDSATRASRCWVRAFRKPRSSSRLTT